MAPVLSNYRESQCINSVRFNAGLILNRGSRNSSEHWPSPTYNQKYITGGDIRTGEISWCIFIYVGLIVVSQLALVKNVNFLLKFCCYFLLNVEKFKPVLSITVLPAIIMTYSEFSLWIMRMLIMNSWELQGLISPYWNQSNTNVIPLTLVMLLLVYSGSIGISVP